MNLVNMDFCHSVTERHPNLVLKSAYLKDLDDVDPFVVSRLYRGEKIEQGKLGVDNAAVVIYKTSFVINGQPWTVSFALGERVSCNTIFSWPFLETIKALTITKNNTLFSGLLGEQFKLDMMVPKYLSKNPKHQR